MSHVSFAQNLAQVSGASVLVLAVVHSVTFAIGRRIGRYNVVDVAWGIGFVAIAAVAATLGHGDPARRWLLLTLVTIWGLRLSWHIQRKTAGKGEDPRYAALLRDATPGLVLRKVFVLQGFITWFVSFPLQLSAVTGPTPKPLAAVLVLGVAVWVVGVSFEALGDRQLRVFKSDPANRGVVMDRGLWAWTRHPNYFGDATVWWGLWLITINGWWPLATVGSPLLMTYFLVYVTGARLTEKLMAGRPGFAEYQRRTAFFFPEAPATGTSMTTVDASVAAVGWQTMTGLPQLSSDLDVLLRQVARGDTQAFATVYDLTKSRVFGLVIRVLRDAGYSEETTQEIYLEVWRSASDYDPARGSALSWLLTMAHRRAIDRVRAEQAGSRRESRYGAANVETASDVVADSAIAGDERRRVADCLGSLTDAQRQCIELAYYGGLTYAEVSQRLSANLSTIKSRIRDALRGLRNCLDVP